MGNASRDFQVFAKPNGAACNLDCRYCYYLEKEYLYPESQDFRMPAVILEEYILQHIEACTEEMICFSWQGGEPTALGLDYFRDITALQRKHQPVGRFIHNRLVTNGTLLNEEWCKFLADEHFTVGLSLDGPQKYHDHYRKDKAGKPTFAQTRRGFELLRQQGIHTDILCVVNAENVCHPGKVYGFFKQIGASYITFLPLVEVLPGTRTGVSNRTVPTDAFGDFLCIIFDKWLKEYIGKITVQIFEEAAHSALGLKHSLCIFRETCGNIPVIEHNGDFYCCDYYVEPAHRLGNIMDTPLAELLDSPAQHAFGRAKFDHLPRQCLSCEVRDMCSGECPRNRFIRVPGGGPRMNYLCAGYKRFFNHCQPFIKNWPPTSGKLFAIEVPYI
jgi:uncharacterized protein